MKSTTSPTVIAPGTSRSLPAEAPRGRAALRASWEARKPLALGLLTLLLVGAAALEPRTAYRQSREERLIVGILTAGKTPDLEAVRERGPDAVALVIKALSEKDSAFERASDAVKSYLLWFMREDPPELTRADTIRLNAAVIVGYLGPAARPAVPQLINLLKDDLVDGNAAVSLGLIGRDAQEEVPALIIAVRENRPFAATALARIAGPTTAARSALEAASRNGPELQPREAAQALKRISE